MLEMSLVIGMQEDRRQSNAKVISWLESSVSITFVYHFRFVCICLVQLILFSVFINLFQLL